MRREGWELVLAAAIRQAATEPFAWGSHDCALWVSAFCDAVTGSDHAARWRGLYRTERGAVTLLRRRGYSSVADLAAATLPEKPVPFAGRGDAVLHPQGPLGLCNGRMSYFLTDGGVLTAPTAACPRAWEI